MDDNLNRKRSSSFTSVGYCFTHLLCLSLQEEISGIGSDVCPPYCDFWQEIGISTNSRTPSFLPLTLFSVPTIHYLLRIQRFTFLIYARKTFIPRHSSISRLLSWNGCMNAIKMAITI